MSMASKESGPKPKRGKSIGNTEGRGQMAAETRPPFTDLVPEEQTPHQNTRGQESPIFLTDHSAYRQYDAQKTVAPGPRRPSAGVSSTQSFDRQEHDLLGRASQASNRDQVGYQAPSAQAPRAEQTFVCPYHGPILDGRLPDHRSGQGLSPMGRYLAEGPSEQHAMFNRPDTGELSTYKGCRCHEICKAASYTHD